MQKTNLYNIARFIASPNRAAVVVKKIYKRFTDKKGRISQDAYLRWLGTHAQDFEKLAVSLDSKIWEETTLFSQSIRDRSQEILTSVKYDLGGSAHYAMLYFLTRYIQPRCIVETGVGPGFSSQAFLKAIKINKNGKLFSSDFPYFRLPNPEQFIGVVVENDLRTNWQLLVDGDEKNLPRICAQLDSIDLFHYDSDKSYSGRTAAFSAVHPKLSEDCIVIFDDIQVNPHFHDHVESTDVTQWKVFKYPSKFVGVVGNLEKR